MKKNNTFLWLAIAGILLFTLTSAKGAANQLTLNYEPFSATAYPDGSNSNGQTYSIGYGHQIQPNEQNLLTATITEAQAEQYLINDLQAITTVLNNSGFSFTPGQFTALQDFGYSAGAGALNKVLTTFQNSGSEAATAEISQYILWHPMPGGPAVTNQNLVQRRADEVKMFNS